MQPIFGLIQLLTIGFILYLIVLIVYTMWGLTHPYRQTYASAMSKHYPGDPSELDEPLEYEEREVSGSKGKLYTWIVKGKNPDGPVIVMTHGWGSSRLGGLKRLPPIAEIASQVILWDLPGHGDSTSNTRLGTSEHHDLLSVIESCVDTDDAPLFLFGWSMGAGVSLAGARQWGDRIKPRGIICESPYVDAVTPARNVIRLRGIPYRLNIRPAIGLLGIFFGVGPKWKGFARDSIASKITPPILIIHGDHDPVCPLEDAQQIAKSAPDATLIIIKDAGHNNLWTDPIFREQSREAIVSFVDQVSDPNT